MCGSLVAVQNKTIQLIHLSIKEFLEDERQLMDVSEPFRELCVAPSEAYLQLTQSCLAYIYQNCMKFSNKHRPVHL